MLFKFAVHKIFSGVIRTDSFLHPSVGSGFSDRACKMVLPYEPPDLLYIHPNPGVKMPHLYCIEKVSKELARTEYTSTDASIKNEKRGLECFLLERPVFCVYYLYFDSFGMVLLYIFVLYFTKRYFSLYSEVQ